MKISENEKLKVTKSIFTFSIPNLILWVINSLAGCGGRYFVIAQSVIVPIIKPKINTKK
ncbi:MAG: hypothetical protein ABIL13_05780 [candidate division WOR-3 bacterium]